jgi:4-hydroxybenzoate decarboxylase
MPYYDLRSYLDALKQEGQLLQVTDPVLPEPDISAAACAVNKLGETAPALLFENIKGYTCMAHGAITPLCWACPGTRR